MFNLKKTKEKGSIFFLVKKAGGGGQVWFFLVEGALTSLSLGPIFPREMEVNTNVYIATNIEIKMFVIP